MFNNFVKHLKLALKEELPGEKAHYKLAPQGRDISFPKDNKDATEASVMLLLYPENNVIHTILIKRPEYKGNHSGQVSFPGGKSEPSDIDYVDTALRETFEEIGIPKNSITIVGNLSPLYIPVSNTKVFPVVGYIDHKPEFHINPYEVAYLISPSLQSFMDAETIEWKQMQTQVGMLRVPYYHLLNEEIWGATAMILTEFLEICNTSNLSHLLITDI